MLLVSVSTKNTRKYKGSLFVGSTTPENATLHTGETVSRRLLEAKVLQPHDGYTWYIEIATMALEYKSSASCINQTFAETHRTCARQNFSEWDTQTAFRFLATFVRPIKTNKQGNEIE